MELVQAVAVAIAGDGRDRVLRVVEGALGWPVVAIDDPLLPARCVLEDVSSAELHLGVSHGRQQVPRIVLVAPDDDPVRVAAVALGAAGVLRMPPSAEALRSLVASLGTEEVGRPWCSVGGAAGGVGTTVVAAAIAGLRAWRHGPTLLAARAPTHIVGAPEVDAADLGGPAVWTAALPVRGVRDLRAVQLSVGGRPASQAVPTVVDDGVAGTGGAWAVDVLVVRADGTGAAACRSVPARHVVLMGGGPASAAVIAAAGDRLVQLPWSARVAAAATAGRWPADAPGRWLEPLSRLVPVVGEAS